MIDLRGEVLKMKEEIKEVEQEQQSFAMEFVHTLKVQNRRLHSAFKMVIACWIITFLAFIGLLGYTIWLLNDIETIETTENTQEITDVENIENSSIINGD